MSDELAERLEILRRIAERGLAMARHRIAEEGEFDWNPTSARDAAISAHEEHLDLWQHVLNELAAIRPDGGKS